MLRCAFNLNVPLSPQIIINKLTQLQVNGKLAFGEVRFYMRFLVNNELRPLALVSLYGPPDPHLLQTSSYMLWSCRSQGDTGLAVVDVKAIISVVAMIPHKPHILDRLPEDRYFVVEKPGLDIADMGGFQEEADEM